MSPRLVVLAALVLAAVLGGGALGDVAVLPGGGDGSGAGGGAEGRVVRVVDGDTIHVMVGGTREKVRYIGVDTPETVHPSRGVECFGREASARNAALVDGELVRLERDAEERDRYGRLLAYVHRVRDGLHVNAELARDGFAQPLTIPPNVRHADRFAALAREAREAGRGLWAACANAR